MRSDVLNKNSNAYDGKTRAEKIFEWDYISCSTPIVSSIGVSADGVMADGDKFGMLFPGNGGQIYPCQCISIGAFTAAGITPLVQGTVVATDTNSTAAGLNLQMDNETAGNTGVEIVLGGSQFGSDSNKFVVGTHSAVIDATFYSEDYTDFDACVIGLRKVQEFSTGHAGVLAAATGDPEYTDFVAFGVQSPDDVQIASDLNNGGSGTYTDSTDATAANGNHRFRIEMTSAGVVTYKHIGAAVMRQGVLAAPSTTASFTFDDGDVLVPYMVVFGTGQDSDQLLKSIDIERRPAIDGHSIA